LGSIYEGLLELHPVIDTSTGTPLFSFTPGSVRKLTGSYYTRHDLVAQLIRTALEPVLEERLKGKRGKEEQEAALLDITVVDPACGSGHFLLAAARKLSERLAQIRTSSENPGKRDLITARRDVIASCIYGVDKNLPAVELCRLALWLEAHTVGKPLTFLEHRIRPGDSLVGVDDLRLLEKLDAQGWKVLRIAAGGQADALNGLRRCYRRVGDLLAYGRDVLPQTRLLSLNRYRLPVMLWRHRNDDALEELLGPLHKVVAKDGNGQLIATLRSWCEHDGQSQACADALGIHRNSLRYRMERIAELSGVDPLSLNGMLALYLGVQLLPQNL
ncbi:MAG: helix-turn-helix domain-containing protein, partial [Pseudomonadales bacterium]|nr:helix-turn-helix domain-containing protein [Pseudomonadales bacterium]